MNKVIQGLVVSILFVLGGNGSAWGLVNFDEGQLVIDGVQLLQNVSNPNEYSYVPPYPRIATKPDGTLELLVVKYVGQDEESHGGLIHALIQLSLPDEILKILERKLQEKVPGGTIVGPVHIQEIEEAGQEAMGSFRIVSAVLSNTGPEGFTQSEIINGPLPVGQGARQAIAAILTKEGITLLYDSFKGPNSDVSVAISGYYEAAVKAYNAKVTADVDTIYKHFSKVSSFQKNYTKRQTRKIVDDLQRNQILKVEVLDRTKGLDIDAKDMEGLLDLVTNKLTELMFDFKAGLSKEPPRETAVEMGQIKGRQKRGWLSRTFGGTQDTKYYTDDQWVMKKREDINRSHFEVILSKSSTIKVPVETAGNIGGDFFRILEQEKTEDGKSRYFRVVNLDDITFQFKPVTFQIAGNYVDSFTNMINLVTVQLRKTYPDGKPAFTKDLVFSHDDVTKKVEITKTISFPRLGLLGADWGQYEYRLKWDIRDRKPISIPANKDKWIVSSDPAISLRPPLTKRVVKIDADRTLMKDRGFKRAVVQMTTPFLGKSLVKDVAIIRPDDAESTKEIAIYYDQKGKDKVGYRVRWYSPQGEEIPDPNGLPLDNASFLFLTPPAGSIHTDSPSKEGEAPENPKSVETNIEATEPSTPD